MKTSLCLASQANSAQDFYGATVDGRLAHMLESCATSMVNHSRLLSIHGPIDDERTAAALSVIALETAVLEGFGLSTGRFF